MTNANRALELLKKAEENTPKNVGQRMAAAAIQASCATAYAILAMAEASSSTQSSPTLQHTPNPQARQPLLKREETEPLSEEKKTVLGKIFKKKKS